MKNFIIKNRYNLISNLVENLPKRRLARMFPEIHRIILHNRAEGFVKPGEIVVQAGVDMDKKKNSNALLLSKAVGKDGKVIAVEPDKRNTERLKKFIDRENIKNIVVIEKAVWSNKKKIKLLLSNKTESNRLEEINSSFKNDSFIDSKKIEADKLDNIMKNNISNISHVCLTINGSELKALKGMAMILKKSRPSLLIANQSYYGINIGNVNFGKMIELYLKKFGYNIDIGKRWIIAVIKNDR